MGAVAEHEREPDGRGEAGALGGRVAVVSAGRQRVAVQPYRQRGHVGSDL